MSPSLSWCVSLPECYISLSRFGDGHTPTCLSPLAMCKHSPHNLQWERRLSCFAINPLICRLFSRIVNWLVEPSLRESESLYKPSTFSPIPSVVFSSTQAFSQPNLRFSLSQFLPCSLSRVSILQATPNLSSSSVVSLVPKSLRPAILLGQKVPFTTSAFPTLDTSYSPTLAPVKPCLCWKSVVLLILSYRRLD